MAAADELLPIIYHELRRLAQGRVRRVAPGTSLPPSDLVHEAFLRLFAPVDRSRMPWDDRWHFFAAAATAMRDILVEHARRRAAFKRGGNRQRVDLDDVTVVQAKFDDAEVDVLKLDAALSRLSDRDPRKAQVVMLRYFAGLSLDQTARALEISPATVKREWAIAKALLYDDITHHAGGEA